MIFLTVGNWHKGFDRLVRAIDELKSEGVIAEEVIAQTGYSSYKPKNMKLMEFCSPAEFRNLISNARLVISHAGMGTIIETVQRGKPLIAVPRRKLLDEADSDHQFATAKQLEKEGKILVAYGVSELPRKLEEAESFVPIKEHSNEKIIRAVGAFLEKLEAKKTQAIK